MMKESYKLVCSTIFLLVVFYLSGISNVYTHNQAVKNKNIYPLQDLGFKVLSDLDSTAFVGMNDYLLYVVALIVSIWTIIFSNKKIIIFKRWTLMVAVLFLIRCITVPSTILTRPFHNLEDWKTCTAINYDYGHILLSPIKMIADNKLTCFDFFFSGHTINIIVPTLIFQKYFTHNNIIFRYFMVSFVWSISIACMFFIIFLHSHYTIDVEAGLAFTILIWKVMDYQMEYQFGLFSYWETKTEEVEQSVSNNNDIEIQIR